MDKYYAYILTNKKHTVLYVGMTNNLKSRLKKHKSKNNKGFTKKYNVHQLIWFKSSTYVNILH